VPQLPASQVLLHLRHRVARKHPGAHRQAVTGERQADDDLRGAVVAIFAIAPLAQWWQGGAAPGFFVFILVIDLEGDRGGVPESDEVHIRAEEVGRAEEDLPLHGLDMGIEEVQRKVALFHGQSLRLGKVDPLGHPVVVASPLGERLGETVGHHGEERQLMGSTLVRAALEAAQDLADAQLFPQGPGHMAPNTFSSSVLVGLRTEPRAELTFTRVAAVVMRSAVTSAVCFIVGLRRN
jgi:hypothetical protein